MLLVSSMVLKETLLVPLLSVVLKEGALLTWCSMSWKENFFPPRLTWGLERSLSASIFDCVFDFVGIIFVSDDSYAIYTKGLERSWLVLLSSASCVGWGLERNLSAHLTDDSYAVYTKGLERSQHVSVMLSSASWGLERSLSAHAHSHGLERTGWMVLKGLWCNSLVPQLCFAIYFQARVLKGISGAGVCFVFYGWNRLRNIFS